MITSMSSNVIKRTIAMLLTAIFCLALFGNTRASAYTFSIDFDLHSNAAILYCRDTDQILYEKNANQSQQPGHLAQIMTAILVLEQCDDIDNTNITADNSLYASLYNYDVDDVRYADIYNGDRLSVREYLYALLMTSSCEAALILANYFGGSETSFVNMMNSKALELGCTDTHFANATGLYDANQTTTANDLLTITNYALRLPNFETIASTVSYTPTISSHDNHSLASNWVWTHSNPMMQESSDYYYEGAFGIKTGNLNESGRSIITEATIDNTTYLVILLNAPFTDANNKLQYYHLEDAINLFDWAASTLTYTTILEDDEEVAEVEVANSDGNSYVLVKPEKDCVLLWNKNVDTSAIQKVIQLEENVQAPIETGQQLGTLQLKFSGEIIAELPLVAVSDVERSFLKFNLYALRNFQNSPWFLYGIVAALLLSIVYIILCVYASYRAKRNTTPEAPIHLIPKVKDFHDSPQQFHRDHTDTIYYHGEENTKKKDSSRRKDSRDDYR